MAFTNFVDLVKWVGRFLHEGTIGLKEEASAPGTPPLDQLTVYAREKGGLTQLFYKDSSGVEHDLSLVSTALQAGQVPVFISDVEDSPSDMSIPGPQGLPGSQGLAGAPGLEGEAGDPGDTGPPGLKGETGATGAAGADGAAGATGAQGAIGPAVFFIAEEGEEGPMGPPGAAAAGGSNHNILSATHLDSLAASVVRGDLIVGNSTPAWARLARGTVDGLFPKISSSDLSYAADVAVRTDATNNRFRYLNIIAKATRTTNLSVSDAAATIVDWDAESFDTHDLHDNATNPSRITVPIAGKYIVIGNAQWDPNATGLRQAEIRLNNTSTIGVARGMAITVAAEESFVTAFVIAVLAAGDFVTMRAYQTSGGALNLLSSTSYFAAFYIGE